MQTTGYLAIPLSKKWSSETADHAVGFCHPTESFSGRMQIEALSCVVGMPVSPLLPVLVEVLIGCLFQISETLVSGASLVGQRSLQVLPEEELEKLY